MFSKKPGDAKPTALATPVEAVAPAAANQVAGKPADQPRVAFRFVDRPDCPETFADSVVGLLFDGQSLRLDFGVSRLDERKPDAPLTGRRYPVCRLVLSPAAAVDLINKMQQVAAALAQTGVVKAQAPGDPNTK
jgi:hypothetical protein